MQHTGHRRISNIVSTSNPRAKPRGVLLISGADDRLRGIAASLCNAYHLTLKGVLRKPTKIRDIVSLLG